MLSPSPLAWDTITRGKFREQECQREESQAWLLLPPASMPPPPAAKSEGVAGLGVRREVLERRFTHQPPQ